MVWRVVVLARWWESGGEVIRLAWTREERIGRERNSWLVVGCTIGGRSFCGTGTQVSYCG